MILGLAVAGLSLRLGKFALRDIDLDAGHGEILALLGPNGSGKSVMLETVAGFHRPAAGRIEIAGDDVTGLPPERRQVSLVPQNYGLFPHLSVAGNIALPLRLAERARPGETVAALLDRFGIAHLAARLPRDLSPGERQRAALARALAARPRLFLLDEPFSALDARTREDLRDELRAFLHGSGIPTVFVTHDLGEAMGLADRLAIIECGRILQQGRASDVYRRPAGIEAAAILGVDNLLSGEVVGEDAAGLRVRVGDAVLRTAARRTASAARQRGAITLAIRAEDVALRPAGTDGATGGQAVAATVRSVAEGGPMTKATLDCGFTLVARMTSREAAPLDLSPGLQVMAEIAPDAIRLLG